MADLIGGDTRVRRATLDDVSAVHALGEAVIGPTYRPIDPAYADFTARTWWSKEALTSSIGSIAHWVAEADGVVVGVANLGLLEGRPVMWKLYVHPDRHGQGLGRALLAEVVAAADGPLTLEYLDGNERALAFYRGHGFVETHRTGSEDFPHLSWVWMRRDPR